MKINIIEKQKISDKEFQSIKGIIHPTALAYEYVVCGKRSITLDLVIKADLNEQIAKPYLREYIRAKEESLGKSKLLFSKEQIDETLEELENLYHTLKRKGILY